MTDHNYTGATARPSLTEMQFEILEECAGIRSPRLWGAAVGACLESLRGYGFIERNGKVTSDGATAIINAYEPLKARLAEVERERDEAIAALKWTNEVYPARIEGGGAGVEITWDEFNAMRKAAGFRPVNRIGDEEGRAGFNHRLRTRTLAAEARVAVLEKVLESIRQYGSDTLSGRADGGSDDRQWQREAVREMTRRARTALAEQKGTVE